MLHTDGHTHGGHTDVDTRGGHTDIHMVGHTYGEGIHTERAYTRKRTYTRVCPHVYVPPPCVCPLCVYDPFVRTEVTSTRRKFIRRDTHTQGHTHGGHSHGGHTHGGRTHGGHTQGGHTH